MIEDEAALEATEEAETLLSAEPVVEEAKETKDETPGHLVQETDALMHETKETKTETAERPEWLPEQFWKDGKADQEGLGKAYQELRTKMSQGKHKAPKDGKYELPEFDGVFSEDDPAIADFLEIAKEEGLSQDLVSRLAKFYAETTSMLDEHIQTTRSEEMAKLGRNSENVIKTMDTWLTKLHGQGVLSDEELKSIANASQTATFISALNKIRSSYNDPVIPGVSAMDETATTLDDIQSLMSDERYGKDMAYTKGVEKKVYQMHGEKPA
jgi:hypothetical protein